MNAVSTNQNQYYFSCQSFQKLLTFEVMFVHSLLGWTQNWAHMMCVWHSESVLMSSAAHGVQSGLDHFLKDSVSL